MVLLSKIYTKAGDKGRTSLGDGARVSKHSLRIESIGQVDEVNTIIGLCRLHTSGESDILLAKIQNDLFDLGADLCIPGQAPEKLAITPNHITTLEQALDAHNDQLSPLRSFVLPGGTPLSAHLHQARTVTRRAERTLCAVMENETVNECALQYLNRLSDLLFVLARYFNDKGQGDILWQPGKNA